MAATGSGSQRLTFYEDLYLRPHKKSASMPSRRSAPTTPVLKKNERRQSSISEGRATSSSKSPVNNPLLDSPPPSRPLTLAANATVESQARSNSADKNNNNNEYQNLSAVMRIPSASTNQDSGSIYENHRQARATKVQKPEHVYEVIPANFPVFYQGAHNLADENNYIVPRAISNNREISKHSRQTTNTKELITTNLRAMRKIGRSIDSIKPVQDNKLRSQSTILAPRLWVKAPATGLANSASCDNLISNKSSEQLRLSTMANPEKENRYPYTCLTRQTRDGTGSDYRHTSPRAKRSQESTSQRDSASSLHSATMRATPSRKVQHNHKHSASYSGYPSTYENIAHVHKNLKGAHSEYVNIEDYLNQPPELNYADLDLTVQKPSQLVSTTYKHRRSASASPTKQTNILGESNDDSVEYTLINIAATEAARLACKEHQQDRQRRTPTAS